MKPNFPLEKLEIYLEDEWLMEAEIVLGAQKLKSLSEVEKNLWLARYDESAQEAGLVETEVQLVGGKVKAFACDCATFSEKNVCAHVAATLISLLERKKNKEEIKAAQKPATAPKSSAETGAKLTIPNILKRVETQQLIDFIADYARQDKQFALALKTRFAGDLASGDVLEHYKSLVDNTLRGAKNPKGKVTPKGWQQLFTMLDELRQKAESHFKSGELVPCFQLISLALPLVHRFLRSLESPKLKLEKRQLLFYELLRGFETLLISPELNENMWEFHLSEFNQNAKHPFAERVFIWLLGNADTPNRVESLLKTIDQQIHTQRAFLEVKERLLTQKVQVLQKNGRIDEASELILSSSQQPEVLFFAVQNAYDSDDLKLAKSLCQNGLAIFQNNPTAVVRLETFLLQIAQRESDTEGVLLYAERLFLKTYSMEYYHLLKQHNVAAEKIDDIVQFIENQPYKIERRDTLSAIYAHEKDYVKLTEMILNLQSLELLRRYGLDLWRYLPEAGIEMHKRVMYEYLYTHLGRPPAQRIRSILESHIEHKGWDLVEELVKLMKNDFPERYSLKEELDAMLWDLERKAMLTTKFS